MMKDRMKLQSKLEMYECTFKPQLIFNPGDERNKHTKARYLLTVGLSNQQSRSVKRNSLKPKSEAQEPNPQQTGSGSKLMSSRKSYGQIHMKQVQYASHRRPPFIEL